MAKPRASKGFISGIVLAAGASTRMGRPKQLLPLAGAPLLQHVLDQAAASCLDEVIVVLGHRAEEVWPALRVPSGRRLRLAVNPDYAQGLSTSLCAGLRSASPRAIAAAVLLGDQPGVTPALIDRVAAAFRAGDSPVVRPVYRRAGRRPVPGHPVVLARSVWPEVDALTADEGVRALLAAHPDWLLVVPLDEEPPADIDTMEDYQRVVGGAG